MKNLFENFGECPELNEQTGVKSREAGPEHGMSLSFEQHCTEDTLELYSLDKLGEVAREILEEHLLICEACRIRLDETERYVFAMKAGAALVRNDPEQGGFSTLVKNWFHSSTPVWAAAAAVCVIVFVGSSRLHLLAPGSVKPASDAPVAVSLVSERGGSIAVPSNQALSLRLDARGLALAPKYRVELITSEGSLVEEIAASRANDVVSVETRSALHPGAYFVRMYLDGAHDPVREFALTVKPVQN